MWTLERLKEHIEKYKDALIILGPDAAKLCGVKHYDIEAYKENMTRKKLSRSKEEFWDFFDNYYYNKYSLLEETESQQLAIRLYESGLVAGVMTTTTEGLLRGNIAVEHLIELHGSMHDFICKACKTELVYSEVHDTHECPECGKGVRPCVQLIGERYNEEQYEKFVKLANAAHTIITIGLDYTEQTVNDILAQYCEKKALSKDSIIIGIHDTSIDPNTVIGFHEFLVGGDCDSASERLNKALRQ
jgi:NAD-dependent SIR2 family protein deacetylase